MTFVSELRPQELWSHFDTILTIPRASGQEKKMAQHIVTLATQLGLQAEQDRVGNLVVRKPAANGVPGSTPTVLQCHLDMVQEKNSDVDHDFLRDPISPRRQGEYLQATGTTLGSDNGIGVATCLALMEDRDLSHGDLEFLFTVDEETGLTGAAGLSSDLLKGRRLINLDCEDEATLYVGCAGGSGLDITSRLTTSGGDPDQTAFLVELKGLLGGHSGVDIHLPRSNAIQELARVLESSVGSIPFTLNRLQGGNAHNAIPREARAVLTCPRQEATRLKEVLESRLEEKRLQLQASEPGLVCVLEETQAPGQSWDAESTGRTLDLLNALPHGVLAMSREIPGLVETSANLATVRPAEQTVQIHVSVRSSVPEALENLLMRLRSIADLAGCETSEVEGYPGWQPDLSSQLLAQAKQVFQDVFGQEPEVKVIHAGLECGLIGEKYPGMEMISIGPQIEFPHSPDERVQIASVGRYYEALKRLLEVLAGN